MSVLHPWIFKFSGSLWSQINSFIFTVFLPVYSIVCCTQYTVLNKYEVLKIAVNGLYYYISMGSVLPFILFAPLPPLTLNMKFC